jgi:hypothetical protein
MLTAHQMLTAQLTATIKAADAGCLDTASNMPSCHHCCCCCC